MKDLKEKFKGTIFGLAIGDALGAPYEQFSLEQFRSLADDILDSYSSSDLYGLQPGEYTDDTDMSLCTIEALVENSYLDIDAISDKFVSWFQTDPKDIGRTTSAALHEISKGTPSHEASEMVADEFSAGNGAAMRIAPIALFNYKNTPETLCQNIIDVSLITHHHKDAVGGALAIGLLIYFNLHDPDKRENFNKLISSSALIKDEDLIRRIKAVPGLSKEDLIPDGYIINTLNTVLFHFLKYDNTIEAIQSVIKLGGDTDTNASIIGSLMGSIYGMKNIPPYYTDNLQNNEKIRVLIDKLYEVAVNDKIFY
ncbi:MAG: ADP-ribosylglycohydrolase family protein [Spirochaetes bacterium]|nr:ADP-ribosylglycohydrolase family protein [Spirochaetota bacterium]